MGKFLKMNDKAKNIILKLSKGIVYAYPIGFIALSLEWEYGLFPFVPFEIQHLIHNLFYFGESDVFRYASWFPDRSILTYLFLLIIHFFIRSKIKKQKKKTVLRSLVEKIGKSGGVTNKEDYYFTGILTIVGFAMLIAIAANIVIKTVEFGDYLIVTDAEKAEMREQEAQKRQEKKLIEKGKKIYRIKQLLPNAHPNVRKSIEAKGLELSCGSDWNYTITFDDLNVYTMKDLTVVRDSNYKKDLELFIENSGFNVTEWSEDGTIFFEKYLDFTNWTLHFNTQMRIPNTWLGLQSLASGVVGCRATFKETSNNPSTNSASKPKEPKLNAVPASKSIQEIRESVKNRTQDKDH